MGHISEKSLEQNNVRDSKFFSGYNSFHNLRGKYKKHRDTKVQEDINELEVREIINF
jgi:mRNA-degrading endonuclease YafQ of YafQ-DinJ toxin-antitoxin module